MKLPRIFHASLVNVHHAAFWLAFFSVLSALLGLARDRMLAAFFGANRSLDIYYSAFRIPDFLYTIMLLLAASTAIIPVFLEEFSYDRKRAEDMFGSLIATFCLVILFLAGLAFIFMPYLIRNFLPGFSFDDQSRAIELSRIMLLSPLLLGLSNIFSSITQSFRRFFVYALSPVMYNGGIILGIIFFLPRWGLMGLAWGVVLGALLHMAIQIPSIIHIGLVPRFSKLWNPDIKRIVSLSLPRTIGLATTQIMTMVLTGTASTLAAGSIAIFNLASNLENIPVTLIGLSYSVAAFPNLAEYAISGARDKFRKHFLVAFRHILFWALPFSVLLLVLRAQIVRVILGSGAFSWTDTRLTAAALFLLSIAILFQSLFMLLVRAFYAENETVRPLLINVISILLSIGGAFWFVQVLGNGSHTEKFFRIALHLRDISDIRVLALPLSILGGSLINFIFLFFAFWVIFGWAPSNESRSAIGKIILGSTAGGLVAYGGLNIFSHLFNLQTFIGIFLQGFCAGILGIFATLAVLWVLQSQELYEIFSGMKGLLWRDHIPAPEPEKLP